MEPKTDSTAHLTLEFGPCLKKILKEKRISASELARMMNYKSRNSIFRILSGESSHSTRKAFYTRLKQEDPLSLDEKQRQRLEQALEISRIGMKDYLGNQAMRGLLTCSASKPACRTVRIETANDNPQDPGFRKAIEAAACAQRVHLTIMGCCDRAIFDALHDWLDRRDKGCEVKIVHVIYTGAEEIVRNIAAIQPLLYCDFYDAYCMEPNMVSRERECVYRCSCIYAHVQDARGDWYDRQLLLIDRGEFVPMCRIPTGDNSPIRTCFEQDLKRMPPLKKMFDKAMNDSGYLDFAKECCRLEQNRAIYMIKLDVPLSFVQPDIVASCVMDGMIEKKTMEDMIRVHQRRFDNYFTKKKVSHVIFSREAMERFARTGRQSDHFFALRSYTPEERVRILRNLREHEERNPNFHVHFFEEGYQPPSAEVGLYEGVGTLMAKPYTDYTLTGEHAETIITQKEFCARYKAYFMNDLLERHVMNRKETLAVLDELIETAGNA